eukprot:6048-Prorocentrum_minimum.AAC.3
MNLVVAMPGVNPFQRMQRPAPRKPNGDWSKLLQSMNDSSPVAPASQAAAPASTPPTDSAPTSS